MELQFSGNSNTPVSGAPALYAVARYLAPVHLPSKLPIVHRAVIFRFGRGGAVLVRHGSDSGVCVESPLFANFQRVAVRRATERRLQFLFARYESRVHGVG